MKYQGPLSHRPGCDATQSQRGRVKECVRDGNTERKSHRVGDRERERKREKMGLIEKDRRDGQRETR